MSYTIALIVFVLGTIIGSFLNVVILRYNTGMSIVGSPFSPKGRSQCFSCGKALCAFELVPILSFVFLRGKCSACKSKISWQYPAVEFITGLIFAAIFIKNLKLFSGFSFQSSFSSFVFPIFTFQFITTTIFYFIIWSILIVITVYDLKHKIIPNGLVYAFVLLSLFSSTFTLTNLLVGPLFFLFFYSLWFFSKGKWVGFGDAKLSLGIGFLLGLVDGVSALIFAFWIGAAVSILIIALGALSRTVRGGQLRSALGNLTMKSEIPFAPFLILGTLIAFFCNIDIFGLSNLF